MDESDGTKQFIRDEKMMTVEELSELVIDHMEFCGMDSEFYLPDPHDATCLCFILHDDHKYIPASVVKHFHSGSISYYDYSQNNLDLAYKAIMSVLDDSIKQSTCPLLSPMLKYGPILWIYVVHEVRTVSFQHIKSLECQLESLKLCQTEGENVKQFTTKCLQIFFYLGKNSQAMLPLLSMNNFPPH